ncbi:DUF1367 family protein [bacterium]|nr:DUF1367 family protein [bacterium]
MSSSILCKVVPGGLMCLTEAEAHKLEGMVGQEVKATITKPRNLRFLKKYFALLKVGMDMADTPYNPEQFRMYVQAGAGYCEFIEGKNGLVAVPQSISFGKMDEIEFARLYSNVLDFICEQWALDADEVDKIVGFM